MEFKRNEHGERRVWVDRGLDSRVDDFEICSICDETLEIEEAILEARDGLSRSARPWHDESLLCGHCQDEFANHAAMSDEYGLPRPFNLDRESNFEASMEMQTNEACEYDVLQRYRDEGFRM